MPRWLLAVLFIAGCSFGLHGPKDDRPRNRAPECSTKKGVVVLDTIAGSVLATTAAVVLATDEPGWAVIPAALAATYFAAALTGNKKVNACRGAQEEFQLASARPPIDLTGVRENAPELPEQTIARVAPPPAQAPPAKAAATPAPQPSAEKPDEWSVFWREVTP